MTETGCVNMIEEDTYFNALIKYGMFFKEVPEEFHSTDLIYARSDLNVNGGELSELIDFSFPKSSDGTLRRYGSIPNPYNYLKLSAIIAQHWKEVETTHFSQSNGSLSTPILNEDKTQIIVEKSLEDMADLRIKYASEYPFILKLDITDYYPSIDLRLISWSFHGDKKLLGKKLEKSVKDMQQGRITGIPVGPVTSDFISEIVGIKLIEDITQIAHTKNIKLVGSRYIDDMEFYFNTEAEARWLLEKIERLLNKYGLELQSEKTGILPAPFSSRKEYLDVINGFIFKHTDNIEEEHGADVQRKDIVLYFNRVFQYYKKKPRRKMLKYAVERISNQLDIYQENWDLFESLLIKCTYKDPSTTGIVFSVMESYFYKNVIENENILKLTEYINAFLHKHLELGHHYEMAQALSFSRKLRLKMNGKNTKGLEKQENSLLCILTMNLYEHGLLTNFDSTNYVELLKDQASPRNHLWLFAYESVIHQWFNSDIIQIFDKSSFFMDMLEKKISFFDAEKG